MLTLSRNPPESPTIYFTPYAWAKLNWFCHAGDTEIGGFGLTEEKGRLDLVTDFVTVKQKVTAASVIFDKESIGDFFEDQVDRGLQPYQFGRIWLHTHPGSSPHPSGTDENTFAEAFGACNFSAMFIMARDGSTYCRCQFNQGPFNQVYAQVAVDYSSPFEGSSQAEWKVEYDANVEEEKILFANTWDQGGRYDQRWAGLNPNGASAPSYAANGASAPSYAANGGELFDYQCETVGCNGTVISSCCACMLELCEECSTDCSKCGEVHCKECANISTTCVVCEQPLAVKSGAAM